MVYMSPQGIPNRIKDRNCCWVLTFLQAVASIDIYCSFAQSIDFDELDKQVPLDQERKRKALPKRIEQYEKARLLDSRITKPKVERSYELEAAIHALKALRLLTVSDVSASDEFRDHVYKINEKAQDRYKAVNSFDDPVTLVEKVIPIWHHLFMKKTMFKSLQMSADVEVTKLKDGKFVLTGAAKENLAEPLRLVVGNEPRQLEDYIQSFFEINGDVKYTSQALPAVLFISLARLRLDNSINLTPIRYNSESVLFEQTDTGETGEYRLMARMRLANGSSKMGDGTHYFTIARRQEKWYQIDDASVSPSDAKGDDTLSGCLLLQRIA